jgi:hypothetical protein
MTTFTLHREDGSRDTPFARFGSGSLMMRSLTVLVGRIMRFKDQAEWPAFDLELDFQESRNFLVGLSNGMWMSALLAGLAYWLMQIWVARLPVH